MAEISDSDFQSIFNFGKYTPSESDIKFISSRGFLIPLIKNKKQIPNFGSRYKNKVMEEIKREARITNNSSQHQFAIGAEVEIVEERDSNRNGIFFLCRDKNDGCEWWVKRADMKIYDPNKTEEV